jgi:hypothetical protein
MGFFTVPCHTRSLQMRGTCALLQARHRADTQRAPREDGRIRFDDVSASISTVISGIDPQTKKFTEPPEQIKKEIAALKADKTIPEAQKKQDLAELEAALKIAKPVQFKENIALVLKYFDKLLPLMMQEPGRG